MGFVNSAICVDNSKADIIGQHGTHIHSAILFNYGICGLGVEHDAIDVAVVNGVHWFLSSLDYVTIITHFGGFVKGFVKTFSSFFIGSFTFSILADPWVGIE
jgi:hypothetical protein